MSYLDPIFLCLMAAIWAVARAMRPWPVCKEWFLIAVSLFIIATWGLYDLTLFLAMLLVNYGGAIAIVRAGATRSGAILAGFIALDVLILALFKYANFLGDNLRLFGGLKVPRFPLGIPLAISFYTFHLISYLVDLRKGRVRLASVRDYLFYLSFFPHVIAGPIVRAWQLIPQIGRVRRVRTDFLMGIHFIAIGFMLKAVAANNIAQGIDPIWEQGGAGLSALDHWVVACLYYCQIYGDFAGYSLIALGMSRLLGYRLPANFRAPILAASLREFWQRWHITLSRWLRDYLYIPLGGNRGTAGRVSFNVLLTMLLGGLWHGAGWGFLAWGAMHGAGILLERGLGTRAALLPVRWLATQAWVVLAWVFFRSSHFGAACAFVAGMFSVVSRHSYFLHKPVLLVIPCALPVLAHHLAPALLRRIPRRNLGWALGLATGLALFLDVVVLSPEKTFIYFRF